MSRLAVALEDLIAPLDLDGFFERYWEEDRLHVHRNQSGFYNHLFSLSDVDRWLMSTRDGDPDSILIAPPEGTVGGSKKYRPGEISIDEVYDLFSRGYSIVLNGLERNWHPMSPLIGALGNIFCADIGINVYLTPEGSRTFSVHIDDHDVFVLQVYGAKDWRLHEFEHLPNRRLDYRKDLDFPGYWHRPEDSPLLEEMRLSEGDLLYIPRGMPHCAVAKDMTSLHITVSINGYYWTDLLKAALEQSCFDAPLLRKTLPPRFVSDPAIRQGMRDDFKAALAAFQDIASFDDALKVMMRRRVRAQDYPRDGHLTQLVRLKEVTVESEVKRRDGILCMVEHSDEYSSSTIRFGKAHIRGPRKLLRALEFIRDNERFKVGTLPGLDDKSKVVLTRRLIREGMLRLVDSQ